MALSLADGCTGEGRAPSTVTIADSAGIEIVESVEPAWATGQEWSVDATPSMSIGGGEQAEEQFYRVVGVARLSDGRVAVADAGSQEIRLFTSDGRFLSSMGGKGAGPGEFTDLEFMAMLPGDSIFAYNGAPTRVTIFGPDGNVARTTQVAYPVEHGYADLEAVGILDDGRIVAYRNPDYLSVDFVDGLNREPLALRLLDPWTGKLDTLGAVPGTQQMVWRVGGRVRQTLLPFGRFPDIAARDTLVYVAPNDDFAVNVLSPSGVAERIVRATRSLRGIDDGHMTQYIDNRVAEASDAQKREYTRLVRDMPVPETFPPYSGIEVDLLGNLWVADYAWPPDTPPRYTVFSADGVMLGSVTLPPGLRFARGEMTSPVMEIGRDYVLGVWHDALDVEHVRLYALTKP